MLAGISTEELAYFGRFHLLLVHLPIALILLQLLLDLWTRKAEASSRLRRIAGRTRALACLSAVLSAVLGLLLAAGAGYSGQSFVLHRGLGIALGAVALIILAFPSARLRPLLLLLAAALVFPVAHFGGSLVHGEDFLTENAPEWLGLSSKKSSAQDAGVPGDVRTYHEELRPALDKHCVSCHGSERQEGKLRLDVDALTKQSGRSKKLAIVPFRPRESEALRRVLLPSSHEDHMPPNGKQALSPETILALHRWIQEGARTKAPKRERRPAPLSTLRLAKLQTLGIRARHFGPQDGRLSVLVENPTPEQASAQLEALGQIADRVIELTLRPREFGRATSHTLAQMQSLERLEARGSKLTTEFLSSLASLPRLRILGLFASNAGDASLSPLTKSPSLERIYLGGTRASAKIRQDLRDQGVEVFDSLTPR